MSNLLHGQTSTNQILPQEKRVNRDIFGTTYKTELMGFLMMNKCGKNYQLILNLLHISSQKWLVFANYFAPQTFHPNWPIFLHGYIRDIFQLWLIYTYYLKIHTLWKTLSICKIQSNQFLCYFA